LFYEIICWNNENGVAVNISLEITGLGVIEFQLHNTSFLNIWNSVEAYFTHAIEDGYCCNVDAGAHSGEFIFDLENENFVYKDIMPGG
jgi:hypothetical protein